MRRAAGASLVAAILIGALVATSLARAEDDETLRSRIGALADEAERAGASDLLDQASHALIASDRLRAAGDAAGAERADGIAEAAVLAAERRVEAHRAARERDAARARLEQLRERARTAHEAVGRAHSEHARVVQRAAADAQDAAEQEPAAPEGE